MQDRFALIPIKKRILAFATDGEIEAKLRQILARRWGGNNFPKLTEIVYRLYMQWGRQGGASIFKQGGLSARVVKIIDDAIAEACGALGIATWEAKNAVRKLDREINMAFKKGVTNARLDLKKLGISMALERRNEMLFDLNRAYREFDRSVRFAVRFSINDWLNSRERELNKVNSVQGARHFLQSCPYVQDVIKKLLTVANDDSVAGLKKKIALENEKDDALQWAFRKAENVASPAQVRLLAAALQQEYNDVKFLQKEYTRKINEAGRK